MTETVETEESDTDRSINIITEIKQLTDRRNYITITIRNDGTEKEFIVDTGSPVTIIPPDKEIIKSMKLFLVTKKYRDVDKNALEFTGKRTVEAESKRIRRNLSMIITEREYFKPLLDMDWLQECNWTIRFIEKSTTQTNQSETDKIIT